MKRSADQRGETLWPQRCSYVVRESEGRRRFAAAASAHSTTWRHGCMRAVAPQRRCAARTRHTRRLNCRCSSSTLHASTHRHTTGKSSPPASRLSRIDWPARFAKTRAALAPPTIAQRTPTCATPSCWCACSSAACVARPQRPSRAAPSVPHASLTRMPSRSLISQRTVCRPDSDA